ncbi:hypothetical protein CBR_g38578 [Chara braunii]|uniref:Uncharacterized protein n=1 Tax=Chara braunii TaxID=69332 RepID=A0A388K0B8_CHABU|nr:hypothetical protein CBR_g38578 [Chara braunii]|eukprot:GBG63510.1 hypothetical protein CBR_g38578 [Chara braunii]
MWVRIGILRVAMAIFLVETALKVTRRFIENYFVRDVPCSLMMLQLAQGKAHYGYLRAAGALRLAGTLAQLTLSILLVYLVHSQGKRWGEAKAGTRRLEQLIHFAYAAVFAQILLSCVIFIIIPFSIFYYSVTLPFKRMAAARRQRVRVLPLRAGAVGVAPVPASPPTPALASAPATAPPPRSPPSPPFPPAVSNSGGGAGGETLPGEGEGMQRAGEAAASGGEAAAEASGEAGAGREGGQGEGQGGGGGGGGNQADGENAQQAQNAIHLPPPPPPPRCPEDDDDDERALRELPALVWYFHCHRHPKLLPVCAFRREDCNCGLPGHWFLSLRELIAIALCRNIDDGVSAAVYQEMALDALGRVVQSGDPFACELIVDADRGGFDRIVNVITDHASLRCRERAISIVWQLANMSRLADVAEENGQRMYDPLRNVTSSPRLAKAGLILLDAAVRKSSPLIQEKAVGALWRLCRNHRMVAECLFSGVEGKARIEELVELATNGPTGRTCLDTLYLLSRLMADCAAPYAHYTRLRGIRDYRGLLVGTIPREGRRREPVRGIEGYRGPQRFWVPPARAAFRESRALPRLIGLALSHASSTDGKELIAVILQCYYELGAANLFPFEAKELARILQVRYYTTAPELLYTAMLTCDLLLSYLDQPNTSSTEDFLPRLIEQDDSTLFLHLLRLELEQWMGPQFALREGIERIAASSSWRQFTAPLSRPPTVRHLFRCPARLMAYLLATCFDLLTVEIEEVLLDDQSTTRAVEIDDSARDEGPVAGMTVVAFWLAALLHRGETSRTKIYACTALTRLAEYDRQKLRPSVVEGLRYMQRQNEINVDGIEDATEFLVLQHELRESLPNLAGVPSSTEQQEIATIEVLSEVGTSAATSAA